MYKGSSADTAWNHDLLWKLRVSTEAKRLGFKKEENVPVHAQREVRIDTARSSYVRNQLQSRADTRPPTEAAPSNAMPREILELERAIREEIAKRQRIEKKLNDLLSMMQEDSDGGASAVLPEKTKSGDNTRRVLDKISQAVAAARRTARGGLPQVTSP
jgi:hypothetical protein